MIDWRKIAHDLAWSQCGEPHTPNEQAALNAYDQAVEEEEQEESLTDDQPSATLEDMTKTTDPEVDYSWHDAGVEVDYRWRQFTNAYTPIAQARALAELSNAMHDLRTWLPGYDYETGTLPWERDDDDDD